MTTRLDKKDKKLSVVEDHQQNNINASVDGDSSNEEIEQVNALQSLIKSKMESTLTRSITNFDKKLKQGKELEKETKQLNHGAEIQKLILSNEVEQIERAYQILTDEINTYKAGKFKLWISLSCGILTGIVMSVPITTYAPFLFLATFDRSGLDGFAHREF